MGRRKLKNAMALAPDLPPPAKNITYDNRTPWPAIILTSFACVVLTLPLLWWIAIYIMAQAGIRHPERALANGIMSIAFAGAFVAVAIVVVKYVIMAILDDLFAHRETMKEMELQLATRQQMTAQHALPAQTGRMTEEQERFAKLITAVMFQAYDHLSKAGQYGGNDARPWSRNQAKEVVLAGESEPVGFTMGARVRSWLTGHQVIRSDQINTDRYPDLASVQALLQREFDAPIQVIRQSPTLRDNAGYMPIVQK